MRYIAAVELYMTPNRPYDPSTGDWLQPDPAGFDAGQTNLFEYCGNSATNATDPSGLMSNFSQGSSTNWGPLKGTDIGGVGNCGCATGVQVGIPDDSGGGTPVMYEEQPGTLPPLLPDAPGKQNNVWTPDSIRSLILSTPEGKLLVKKAESQFPDGVHIILKDVGANAASEATAPPEGMVEPGSNGTLYGHLGDIWLRPGISKSQAVQGLLFEYGNLSQRHEQADNEARGQKKTVTGKDKKDFIKMALIIELRNIVDEIDIYEKYQNQWGCDEKLNLPTDEGMIPAVRKGGQSLETYAQKQIELYDLAPSKSPFQNNIGQYYRNWNDFRQKAKL
jgi:RHS repeat-associated protein